jgi:MoxR-like ATPase
VAWQLGLGNVLRWGVTSRSTLKDALYHYDALARLQDASLHDKGVLGASLDFGDYVTLGPLGTALLPTGVAAYFPRVLLIDEIDKSDADLPSDLLHILEEGAFTIPEVARLPQSHKGATIEVNTAEPSYGKVAIPSNGLVRCDDFPLIFMTSNGDRDFPPAFLRRCLQLAIPRPSREKLEMIIKIHFGLDPKQDAAVGELLSCFDTQRNEQQALLAIDQLLNAIYLARSAANVSPLEHAAIKDAVFRSLSESPQLGEV